MDKLKETLLTALREGMRQPGEQRLYRSGKLPGLFQGRTNLNSEAAGQALRDDLIELVRTELRGKTPIEWVKVTQKGIDFVLQHESPARALDDLKAVLQTNHEGMPVWIAEMKQSLQQLQSQLVDEVHAIHQRLDGLAQRVVDTLERLEQAAGPLPEGTASSLPWAEQAVAYLDRRNEGGLENRCPLPELFAAVRERTREITIRDFHSGLRRLHDRGVLRLLPHVDNGGPPEPEYALLDGPTVYYFAAR